MAQISTADFKTGMTIDLDDGLFNLVDFQHVKPGKGHAFVRTKLKNVRTGAVLERTMRAGEKMERAIVDKNEMSMLYRDGADFVFMDSSTYEQITVPPETVGDAADYLADNSTVVVVFYGAEIIGIDLPASVDLEIAETEPGLQGDRSSGGTKPATLSTGKIVQVPLFIDSSDTVKIDTRTGEYLTRA